MDLSLERKIKMIFRASIPCTGCRGTGQETGGICLRCNGLKWITLTTEDNQGERKSEDPEKNDEDKEN
jgi:DnaJ-class molecular chaperone